MALDTNLYTQAAGQGEAVIIDPTPVNQSIEAERNRRAQQDALMGRIRARQQQDADKAAKEEFYKLAGTQAGDAGFLTPYANEERQKLIKTYSDKIAKGEPIDENEARLAFMGEQNYRQLGNEFTQNLQKRYPNLEKDNFVNTPEFERAVQAALKEDRDKYLANPGANPLGYKPNEDAIVNAALQNPMFNVFNTERRGEAFRKPFSNITRTTHQRPGQPYTETTGQALLKNDANSVQKQVDMDLYRQGIDNPIDRQIISNGFSQKLRDPSTMYGKQDIENQAMLANGLITKEQYAETKKALLDRYVDNEHMEAYGLTPEKLGYNIQGKRAAFGPQGRARKPEEMTGRVIPGTQVIRGKGGQEMVATPEVGLDYTYPTKVSQLTEIPATRHLTVSKDGRAQMQTLPDQPSVDTYNAKFSVLPRTTKPVTVERINPKGGRRYTVTIPAGTVIGDDQYMTKDEQAQVFRDGDAKPSYGALIPAYQRQYKKGAQSALDQYRGEEAPGTYLSESNMVNSGYVFKPRGYGREDVLFKMAVQNTLKRNGGSAEKTEAQLMKEYEAVKARLGVDKLPSSSASIFRNATKPKEKTVEKVYRAKSLMEQ